MTDALLAMTEISAILNRIEVDVARLREIISNDTPSTSLCLLDESVKVPALKRNYKQDEAAVEKVRIEDAYRRGLITWDKKRGLKMLVTKRTDGWTPEMASSALGQRTAHSTHFRNLTMPLNHLGNNPPGTETPVLKKKYTQAEAESEKAKIEQEFITGRITWDKKRGLKMLVTKSTEGWTRRQR